MSFKDELLFDFAVNMPRVLVTKHTAVLDNVRKLMTLTDSEIVVLNGLGYTSLAGKNFVVTSLNNDRMIVAGEVDEIRFFKALQEDKDRGDQSFSSDK